MSKKKLFAALIMMLGLNLETANAYHCTCWASHKTCVGRVDPFGGDLVACGNACKHYTKGSTDPYIDGESLLKCQSQNAPTLGPW